MMLSYNTTMKLGNQFFQFNVLTTAPRLARLFSDKYWLPCSGWHHHTTRHCRNLTCLTNSTPFESQKHSRFALELTTLWEHLYVLRELQIMKIFQIANTNFLVSAI